jgi:type I restriction enzyme S subunit
MILTKYDSYKDSGVNWLKEIPLTWKSYRFKDISLIQTSNVDKKTNKNEEEVLLCNYVDVYKNDFITKSLNFMKATAKKDQISKFKLSKNDVIITKDSETAEDMAKPALVLEDLKNIICGYHLALVRSKKDLVNNKYIFRLFQSSNFHWNFIVKSKGVTRVGLSINNAVNNQDLFLPPILEQIKISNFLDKKTSQIDKKIELLQGEKENYGKLKKTLINKTVCRGLNKNVELKDSGIEWIGKIPGHWTITRGKNIFYELRKSKISASEGQNQGMYKFFTSSVNQTKWIDTFTENSEEIIFSTGGIAGVHYCDKKFSYSTDCWAIKSKNQFLKYFYYYFKSILYEIDKIAFQGAGLRHLKRDFIKLTELIKPSKEEQIQIANYLDEKTLKIDKIISKINDQIETLKEFRKTLINDVVTGKMRIQDE